MYNYNNMSTKNMRKHTFSPVLLLPGEIRNRIYDFVFEAKSSPSSNLGLPSTCRQTWTETALLPFLRSKFQFTSVQDLMKFVDKLDYQQRCAIRHVKLAFWEGLPDIWRVSKVVSKFSVADSTPTLDMKSMTWKNKQRAALTADHHLLKEHEDKAPLPGTKRAKQATKAERKAAKGKVKTGNAVKKGEFITRILPGLEVVEVEYVYEIPEPLHLADRHSLRNSLWWEHAHPENYEKIERLMSIWLSGDGKVEVLGPVCHYVDAEGAV
jgi:hypothetical protein